jgi:hypothetical protein
MNNRKRGPYQRRFHDPLFPELTQKTTTPEGKRQYGRLYMQRIRKGGGKKK